jgi:hypothetical protein
VLLRYEKDVEKAGENKANHPLTIHVLAFSGMYMQIVEIFRRLLENVWPRCQQPHYPILVQLGREIGRIRSMTMGRGWREARDHRNTLAHSYPLQDAFWGSAWDSLETTLEPLGFNLKKLLQQEIRPVEVRLEETLSKVCNIRELLLSTVSSINYSIKRA